MAHNQVMFEYDPAENILFTIDQYDIATEKDADAFLSGYEEQFRAIGRATYLVSNIDGLQIRANVADYYCRRVKALAERYVLGFTRHSGNPTARMTVRTASLRSDYIINIYDTKLQAIEAVRKMKAAATQTKT